MNLLFHCFLPDRHSAESAVAGVIFFLNQPVRFFPEVTGQAACQFEIGLQILFGHPAVSPLFRLLQTVDRPVCQRLTGSRQKDFFVVAGAGNRDQLHEAVFHKAVDGCVNCLLGRKILTA